MEMRNLNLWWSVMLESQDHWRISTTVFLYIMNLQRNRGWQPCYGQRGSHRWRKMWNPKKNNLLLIDNLPLHAILDDLELIKISFGLLTLIKIAAKLLISFVEENTQFNHDDYNHLSKFMK